MAVYVDPLIDWGWKYGPSCHLVTDGPIDELHEFASKIGMRRSWFQPSNGRPHYDLSAKRRKAAVRAGAIEITSKELVRILKR